MLYPPFEQLQNSLSLLAIIVSACAVSFTIFSFWWLHARQGNLKAIEPHSFAAMAISSVVLKLRFPLVLYNTGPKPIIVQDFLLRFPDEPKSILPLPWRATYLKLRPDGDHGKKLPTVFVVPGRSAEPHFIEFGGPFPGFALEARDYRVQIWAKLGHRKRPKHLLNFTIRTSQMKSPELYQDYQNSLPDQTKEDKSKSDNALLRLLTLLQRDQVSKETES